MFIVCLSSDQIRAQDTIYSYFYPNGIITNDYRAGGGSSLKIQPISNPGKSIEITRSSIKKVNSLINSEYSDFRKTPVISTDPETGKIRFTKVVEFKDATAKNLFDAAKRMPSGIIEYFLVSGDEKDYSYIQYRGRYGIKFAGDQADVFFILDIYFKDGKIKYDYHDFIYFFTESKERTREALVNGTYSIAKEHRTIKELDSFYIEGYKKANEGIWEPTHANIIGSIQALTSLCANVSKSKNDW